MRKIHLANSLIILSGLLATVTEASEVPAEYLHRTTVIQEDLVVTFALDNATYAQGQPISFYLGIENTGVDTFQVCSGWDPMNIFAIMDSCASLEQACIDSSLFFYPGMIYFFGDCVRILPGECGVRVVTWDGWLETWDPINYDVVRTWPAPGFYVALAGLYKPSASGIYFVLPPDGIRLPITISPGTPVDVQPTSWGHLKGLFGH